VALTKVISGMQTGCDVIALEVAESLGIPTGGTCPKYFMTELGPKPEWAERFHLVECKMGGYPARTHENAKNSDGTLWFGEDGAGLACTRKGTILAEKPLFVVRPGIDIPSNVVEWIEKSEIETLNVAGSRGSKIDEGFAERVRKFLTVVFKRAGTKCH
jgi:hypothetical protein